MAVICPVYRIVYKCGMETPETSKRNSAEQKTAQKRFPQHRSGTQNQNRQRKKNGDISSP